ncbi:MAG: tripartite tricarboxylate transporter TctB family protein [Pseudomonadota bacterium]
MTNSADRLSGALFLLFGLALYFAVIPAYVEIAEDGNIAPNTMPNILAWIIALSGACLVVKPTKIDAISFGQFSRMAAFVFVLAIGIYAMGWFGYMIVAPVLSLVIMAMIGERRWVWIAAGAVGVPALIWLLVTQVLDRSMI